MAPKEMSRHSRHSHRRRGLSDSSGGDSSNGDQESGSDDGANDAGGPAFSDASSLKSAASAASRDTLRSASEDSEGSDENFDTNQHTFHLEELKMLTLKYDDSIHVLQRTIKNIHDCARGPHLESILDALDE